MPFTCSTIAGRPSRWHTNDSDGYELVCMADTTANRRKFESEQWQTPRSRRRLRVDGPEVDVVQLDELDEARRAQRLLAEQLRVLVHPRVHVDDGVDQIILHIGQQLLVGRDAERHVRAAVALVELRLEGAHVRVRVVAGGEGAARLRGRRAEQQ